MRETKYRARCRECGHKDKLTIDSKGDMSCKNCGADLGVRASGNLDITIMMSWQDMQRLRTGKELKKPTKVEIEAAYHDRSMSVAEVVKDLDISKHMLYLLINEYEIERRHPVSQRARSQMSEY